MESKYQELLNRLLEINDLDMAGSVLSWDQTTYMPVGGAPARGRQMATLGRLAQEKLIDPAIGRLLDDLTPWAESLPFESDEASLIRGTRRDFEQATKISPEFLGKMYEHTAASYQAWTEARPSNDFSMVVPTWKKRSI